MTTITEQGMAAYYGRDRDALLRVLDAADTELAHLRAYIAGGQPTRTSPPAPAAGALRDGNGVLPGPLPHGQFEPRVRASGWAGE